MVHSLCTHSAVDARRPDNVDATLLAPCGTRRTRSGTLVMRQHHAHDASRARVQAYIQHRYRQAFGATVTHWLPTLVSLEQDGEVIAAAGYRAATERLFLEQYLCAPVQWYLAEPGLSAPPRERIAEVGHFAAMRAGAGRLLVPLLARHLSACGFDWSVITATRELHHLFSRMGLAPMSLARADDTHLSPAERTAWGTYYEHEPIVVAGRLSQVIVELEQA